MTTDEIRRDDHDGVVTLTFTRDDKMNAMTPATVDRRTARGFDRMAPTLLFTSADCQHGVNAFMPRGKKG